MANETDKALTIRMKCRIKKKDGIIPENEAKKYRLRDTDRRDVRQLPKLERWQKTQKQSTHYKEYLQI